MVTMDEAIILKIKELCVQKDITILRLSELSTVSQSTLNEIMQHRSKHRQLLALQKLQKDSVWIYQNFLTTKCLGD